MATEQVWQARWEALKKIVDDNRRAASERMELESPGLDDIYHAMLRLEQVNDVIRPCPPPKVNTDTPPRITMEPEEGKSLTCARCGRRDATVRKRICAFSQEAYGEEVEETICDKCEDEHRGEAK